MSDVPAADDGGPFEEQRRMYDLLSQETRHLILQYILGHPTHLPSLDELAHMMPKNKAAIRDQLQVLAESGIVERYEHPPNEDSRDLPSQFYGLTEHGVRVLDEYNYLRGLPVARAIYANTRLSEKAKRHRDAPRPELPAAVGRVLSLDDVTETGDFSRLAKYIRERKEHARSVDDQIAIALAFHHAGIGPDHQGIKHTEVLERFDVDIEHRSQTVLEDLVEIDILEKRTPPGPDILAISERTDEIVSGRLTDEAEENLEALVAHIDDELQSGALDDTAADLVGSGTDDSRPSVASADGAGRTIRSILADEFGVDPERVIEYLRSGDPVDRLNAAVEAVESAEEVSDSEDYGRILFVNQAYRYRLTERAMRLV